GAIGDDAVRTALLCAEGEDVADRAGRGVAAGVDDQDFPRPDLLDRALLGVHRAAMGREQILPEREVADGPGVPGHASGGVRGPEPVERAAVQAALAQLRGQRGGGDPGELVEYAFAR